MNLESEKGIILVSMFIATFSFGIMPIKLVLMNSQSRHCDRGENEHVNELERQKKTRNAQRWKSIISLANCFSGGVFVAACLLDLCPGKCKF